jgi:conjugal transfer pilus assembly protein TrbC
VWATDRVHAWLRLRLPTLLAVGALLNAVAVTAQPTVTDADIERARQRHRMPTEAELARIPVPAGPRIEALPQPATSVPIDLEALSRGFDAHAGQPGLPGSAGPRLLVFVSFAMPEVTITRLLDQAARAQATVMLRGLVNGSIRDTVERMQRLIGSRRVAVQIDPQSFDRFSVVRTPSFVLVRDGAATLPCATGMCIAKEQFAMAAGDVSLDYALKFFERSMPAIARDASSFLRRMKGAAP